jgi:cellulose biosynthesis protein BcsQ
VGKTTAAVNLAYFGAASGKKTVILDLDAQGAASYLLRVDAVRGVKAKRLAAGKRTALDAVVPSVYPNLDVLPASRSLRKLDLLLHDTQRKKDGFDGLSRAMKRFAGEYELVVVDAPAGIHLEVERIAAAADLILVPVVPTPLALDTYRRFREFLEIRTPEVPVIGFMSMADRRKRLHRDTMAHLEGEPGFWNITIPFASVIESMSVRRAPLPAFTRKGKPRQSFQRLWEEAATILAN